MKSSISGSSTSYASADYEHLKKLPPALDYTYKINSRDLVSLQDLIDSHALNSPTPPRSPSWREGLESPPFSPRRRDSYPGKRRGSLSPKEKKNHFSYSDISPPSRQLSLDDLYGDSMHPSTLDNGVAGSQVPQKPSPMSPEEMKDSLITTTGETLVFDMPAVRAKPPTSISGPPSQFSHLYPMGSMSHSAPVMDLATYAATIANSTASLTSMSVSPTNLLPLSSHHSSQHSMGESVSPDSVDSADSSCSSPVSPGFYDNATPSSDEIDEVELADPSSKSIDFQGSKRQKVRPPSTDWSPVIDLSPILDVSPSVEEAEQEDMLAKQMEELERQRSRDEAADDEYDDEEVEETAEKSFFDPRSFPPAKKVPPPVIPRIPPPPSAKKLKQQLNEEQEDEYDNDDLDVLENGSPYTYSSTLKRCGNFEDISRLGSDNSLIKHTSDQSAADRALEDMDTNDTSNDLPFFSCTTQSQTLPYSAPSTSSSTVQSPIKQVVVDRHADEQGTKKTKDLEALISDEIHKITEDMENIVRRGAMDVKPIPPPKPKRRLPDPELVISPPGTKIVVDVSEKQHYPSIKTEDTTEPSHKDSSFDEGSSGKYLPRQDSTEKKKAKDMKAKPSPILVQHIEAEEQSVSPHYKVMESPPTPETKTIKREFSDSTSVSPNSSPDQDAYAFPSPVTPPDSDSSPPKPHSPSSLGVDFDEESCALPQGRTIPSQYDVDSYRVSSPYDNARPTHKPRTTLPAHRDSQTISVSLRQDHESKAVTYTTPEPEAIIKPPISPRKSIRKFDEQKINGGSSPLYENVTDLTTQEYLKEQEKHAMLVEEGPESFISFKGLAKMEAPVIGLGPQYTEIVTFPVVRDFRGRTRSSSVPTPEVQAVCQQSQRPEPPVRPRSASADQDQGVQVERTSSVRDKIRAFEEVNYWCPSISGILVIYKLVLPDISSLLHSHTSVEEYWPL